jgi:hypothetical protein
MRSGKPRRGKAGNHVVAYGRRRRIVAINVASAVTSRADALSTNARSKIVIEFSSFCPPQWRDVNEGNAGIAAERERPQSAENAGRICTSASAEESSLRRYALPATRQSRSRRERQERRGLAILDESLRPTRDAASKPTSQQKLTMRKLQNPFC